MSEPSVFELAARLSVVEQRLSTIDERLGEIEELRNLIRDIHRSLFDPPRPNQVALIDRVIYLVETAEKSRWSTNLMLKVLLTVGGLATGLTATLKLMGVI